MVMALGSAQQIGFDPRFENAARGGSLARKR